MAFRVHAYLLKALEVWILHSTLANHRGANGRTSGLEDARSSVARAGGGAAGRGARPPRPQEAVAGRVGRGGRLLRGLLHARLGLSLRPAAPGLLLLRQQAHQGARERQEAAGRQLQAWRPTLGPSGAGLQPPGHVHRRVHRAPVRQRGCSPRFQGRAHAQLSAGQLHRPLRVLRRGHVGVRARRAQQERAAAHHDAAARATRHQRRRVIAGSGHVGSGRGLHWCAVLRGKSGVRHGAAPGGLAGRGHGPLRLAAGLAARRHGAGHVLRPLDAQNLRRVDSARRARLRPGRAEQRASERGVGARDDGHQRRCGGVSVPVKCWVARAYVLRQRDAGATLNQLGSLNTRPDTVFV